MVSTGLIMKRLRCIALSEHDEEEETRRSDEKEFTRMFGRHAP